MMISSSAQRLLLAQPRWIRASSSSSQSVFCHCRQYHATRTAIQRSSSSWWMNPFASSSSGARVTSAKTTGTDAEEDPRKIQERKDTTLIMLAMEFRRLSIMNPNIMERERLIDMAFDAMEQQQLDSKTMMQLRHALQESLQDQVKELFHYFSEVDKTLVLKDPDDNFQDEELVSTIYEPMLEMELELVIDHLANHNPMKAEKGADPKVFLNLKRGALEVLLDRRRRTRRGEQSASSTSPQDDSSSSTDQQEEAVATSGREESNNNQVTWVEADAFGYHETIDEGTNQQIRHYQTINICRAAKLRNEMGYAVIALQSSIPGAGRGVYVDGYAKAGSIVAFQPGEVWSKEHLISLPAEEERKLEKNDNYQMSLRPDDFMIDSRRSPYTVLTNENSNPMAVGHIVNHPTPSNPPNCRAIMVDFTQTMNLGPILKRYIPNTYARPRNLTFTGSLWEKDVVDMHGLCLIATRDICNEEIFYDYRLLTPQRPSWYHLVQDTAYKNDDDDDDDSDDDADNKI
eukprot:scaffold24938_cov147-Cylindrotheca_fusiformis.AAC.1